MTHHLRTTFILAAVAGASACAPQPQLDTAPPAAEEDTNVEAPAAVPDADVATPDADSLLPALPGYTTDDDAEPGEVRASLDHGSVPYEEVRRRLVLDDDGFTLAEVVVVTFRPGSDAGERILAHLHGAAAQDTTTIAGARILRIDTAPFATLAWLGDGFVVTFRRGQERSDAWLEELVRATVNAARP